MKDFLKFTFATVLGIIISSVLFVVIMLVMLGSMAAMSSSADITPILKNSVATIDLNGVIDERAQENPFTSMISNQATIYGLDDVLLAIRKAKENENVKGIYLKAGTMSVGYASLEEIRQALADFKESGKFIVAYADNYTQRLYYLCSVADKVVLNPKGTVMWQGLASMPVFYTDLLKKVGVEMQIFKVGTYKSAVEPYMNTEMSPANREQVSVFLNSIWGQMLADVSASRGIPTDTLNALADRMMMLQQAQDALQAKMVDTLIYRNDMRSYLKKMAGLTDDDKIRLVGVNSMANAARNTPKDKSGNIIAVYYAFGNIDGAASFTSFNEGITSDKVIRDLRKLQEDDDIKAVVLRVNSPGGSAYGSEQIWRAVTELKSKKPVIVSMGDYAASGGYYISCNADSIVADPTTLTGSIGIFGMMPNYGELSKKVGLSYDVVKTNRYADLFGDGTRKMTTDEAALMQNYINQGYELFVKRCAEGRGMTTDAIKKIAEGRVWTGASAVELGLVDELGGIDRALEMAAEKAGVESYTTASYPAKKNFFELMMETAGEGGNYVRSLFLKGEAGKLFEEALYLQNLNEQDRVQARIPYDLNIN